MKRHASFVVLAGLLTLATVDAHAQSHRADSASRVSAGASRATLRLNRRQTGFALRSLRSNGLQQHPGFLRTHALTNRISASMRGLFTGRAGVERVTDFVEGMETRFGGRITDLTPRDMPGFDAFRVEKALMMAQYRRTPGQVHEEFVHARGTVDGHSIADRRIFVQHYSPVVDEGGDFMTNHPTPSGTAFVISPGYGETEYNFLATIDRLTQQGHDVYVMNHQWTGHSEGSPGGMDSADGVARDMAAVTAHVSAVNDRRFASNPARRVVLVGDSMGAGAGVVGAMAKNEAGRIQLEGAQMPRGLDGIAFSPYFRASNDPRTLMLRTLGQIRPIRHIPFSSAVTVTLTKTPYARGVYSDSVTRSDSRSQLGVLFESRDEFGSMLETAKQTGIGTGRLAVIQSRHDALANAHPPHDLVEALGTERAKLYAVRGTNHALHNDARGADAMTAAMAWLAEGRR